MYIPSNSLMYLTEAGGLFLGGGALLLVQGMDLGDAVVNMVKNPCKPDVQVKTARKWISHLFNFVHFGCESIVFVLTYLADFDKKHRKSSKISRSHCVYTAWWVGLSDDWDRDSVDKSNNEFGWKQHRCPRKTWSGLKYRVKVWTYRNPSTIFIERSWTTNHHWGSWGFSPTFVPGHVPYLQFPRTQCWVLHPCLRHRENLKAKGWPIKRRAVDRVIWTCETKTAGMRKSRKLTAGN